MAASPLVVVMSGPPCAGKSTIAQELSERLGLYLLSMDLVKSSIAYTMGGQRPSLDVTRMGGPAGQQAFEATYAMLSVCVDHGVSVIIEKAWQRGRAETDLAPLLGRSRTVQVHLDVSQPIALARGAQRGGRAGLSNLPELERLLSHGLLRWADFGPLDLGVPTLSVPTDQLPLDVKPLVDFIDQHSGM